MNKEYEMKMEYFAREWAIEINGKMNILKQESRVFLTSNSKRTILYT
jgi:hypothetical protein